MGVHARYCRSHLPRPGTTVRWASFLHHWNRRRRAPMYKSAVSAIWIVLLTASLVSIACTRPAPDRTDTQTATPSTTEPAPNKTAADDTWITAKIQAQYFVDPAIKARNIDVTTTNSTVVLAGQVDSQAAKERAEEIARR